MPSRQSNENLPIVVITQGDPAGIGPEIILQSLRSARLFQICRPLIVGDRRILEQAGVWLGWSPLPLELISDPRSGCYAVDTIPLIDLQNASPEACPPGQVSVAAGRASVEYIFHACDLALAKAVSALVTAPINKAAMHLAGFPYAGHTELLAERTGASRVKMLLVAPNLRVVHVCTHVSLADAIQLVTRERVEQTINLALEACRVLGIARPRIAVAGLNPHAGEAGQFGMQEILQISPAVQKARQHGLDVSGPIPPDTVFLRAVKGEFDIVVAMYHDQGHIPVKLLSFDTGVNVSLGLPIVRTSVDHGTAYDIVGRNLARPDSLLAAVDLAVTLVSASSTNVGVAKI